MKLETKLDAKTIAGLMLPDGKDDEIFWDGELVGFGYRLRRRQKGVRATWIAQTRTGDGHDAKETWSDTLSPAEARTAARKFLAGIAMGADPKRDRETRQREDAQTFRAVSALHLAFYEREHRPASVKVRRLYLAGPYFRLLHSTPVNTITHADIAACIRQIENEHSSNTANAARRAVSDFLGWAIEEGLRNPPNPVSGTRRPQGSAERDHVLTSEEMAALWNATGGDSDGDRIIRLLMLLAARPSEIGDMVWSEFNHDGTWTLPKERAKNHHALTLAFPQEALGLLPLRTPGRDFVFGVRGEGFTSWSPLKTTLDERLGDTVRPWQLRDLRRSVSTHMNDNGVAEPHIVEAILNHYDGHRKGDAGRYNRAKYREQIATALARWANLLTGWASGQPDQVVVRFARP